MNIARIWPRDAWRQRGGNAHEVIDSALGGWEPAGWEPTNGMTGVIVHTWRPDGEGTQKSWNSAVNYLLEIDGNYVPIKADGVALKTEDSETAES